MKNTVAAKSKSKKSLGRAKAVPVVVPEVAPALALPSPHDLSGQPHPALLADFDAEGQLPVPATTSKDLAVYVPAQTSDPLTYYLRQINRYKLLSLEQEQALTKALAETGDIEIAKKLVTANLRLVVKIALEYRHAYHNLLDLIQEGNIGLMKAVSKYDPGKGAKLSYYASWWIRSYILKFILDNFRLVRMGTTNEQKKLFYHLLREKQRLQALGITPDTKQISQRLGVSEKAVNLMDERLTSGHEISLDKPVGEEDATKLGDLLPDQNSDVAQIVEDHRDLDLLKQHLGDFLRSLNSRDREIFEKRLLAEIPPSLQEIADLYGVSRERIRQIEERLLKNLKVYMAKYIR